MNVEDIINEIQNKIDEANARKHKCRMEGKYSEAEFLSAYISGLYDAMQIYKA